MTIPSEGRARAPIRALGRSAARRVRAALGYDAPTELDIEVLAYLRGALVRASPARGARANLLRVGDRAVIGVAAGLPFEERRWAVAHELGHFEAHVAISFVGLCSGEDMRYAYEASGREPEANAFAAELLMPEDLARPRCDVAAVSWDVVRELARTFQVSVTAAAIRFVELTEERVAVVAMEDGVIRWVSASRDFGPRPRRGDRVGPWTEASEIFRGARPSPNPETVSASAWIDDVDDDDVHITEHALPAHDGRSALSLLWWKP